MRGDTVCIHNMHYFKLLCHDLTWWIKITKVNGMKLFIALVVVLHECVIIMGFFCSLARLLKV